MIDANRVSEIFMDCLWNEQERSMYSEEELVRMSTQIPALVMGTVCFNPDRLVKHSEEITSMLSELSPNFFKNNGGAGHFNQMPFTAKQEQWGEHINAEELMCLGMGIGKVKYAIEDRLAWSAMPGGVPFIVVDLEANETVPVKDL